MKKKGFTLIEVMVSVTIFSIVMVISLGSLLAISASNKKAETLKTVMNNLNFALDSMSRSIRTGLDYHCGSSGTVTVPLDCPSGEPYFAFKAVDGATVVYRLNSTASQCGQVGAGGCVERNIIPTSGSPSGFLPITSPEVVVSTLTFIANGTTAGDDVQPMVTMALSGYVQVTPTQQSTFNLQTSVTQRLYDQ